MPDPRLLSEAELREIRAEHTRITGPTLEPDPMYPDNMRVTQYCRRCAQSEDIDCRWPCEQTRLLLHIAALQAMLTDARRARWHHSPDAPPEHFCEDCDSLTEQRDRLVEALRGITLTTDRPAYRGIAISHEIDTVHTPEEPCPICAALAAYEEARRG